MGGAQGYSSFFSTYALTYRVYFVWQAVFRASCLLKLLRPLPFVNCHVYLALCTVICLYPLSPFSPQAPPSADLSGTARVSAPLGKVSEWIVLAFRCTVRFLPEAALL